MGYVSGVEERQDLGGRSYSGLRVPASDADQCKRVK